MLTQAQLTALKAHILANADPDVVAAVAIRNDTEITRIYNLSSAFIVWKTSVPVQDIFDAIVWANMTPAAAPDGTTQWTNRNLQCQSKQIALQTIVLGREQLNTSKPNIRQGLQDALTALPSKADGTNQPAGWVGVLALLKRAATTCEAIFATGTGTDTTPGNLGVEGTLDVSEVSAAMNLP